MNLQEVDTIQDLKEWVEENMPGARLTVDSAGDIVIHTGLHSTMGGYLHEKEEKMANDKCRHCGLRGLVLSTANADYVCEHCGEWQDAVLNSGWEIVA